MTEPALAAQRFGIGCLLGLTLGLWYALLRPLRRRRSAPADALFLLGAFCAWLYHGFAVCRGDLRLGYSGGLLLGAAVFDRMLGVPLEPVLRNSGALSGKYWEFFCCPAGFFSDLQKNSCIWGKMG